MDSQLSDRALGDLQVQVPDVSLCHSTLVWTASSQTGLWATCKFKFQTFPCHSILVWTVSSQMGLWATCKFQTFPPVICTSSVAVVRHHRVDCQLSDRALGDLQVQVPDVSLCHSTLVWTVSSQAGLWATFILKFQTFPLATCTSSVAVVRHSRATVSSLTGLWATCKFKFLKFPQSRVSLVHVVGDKKNNVAVLQQGGRRCAEYDPSWEDIDAAAFGRRPKNRPARSILDMPGFVDCH